MVKHPWVITQSTGEFLVGGPEPYEPTPVAGGRVLDDGTFQLPVGRVRVVLDRAPNLRTEKYGDLRTPIVAKSAAEIAAYDTAITDADAAQQFDGAKILKAKAISDLAFRLGKAPGALTAGEIAAERTRIVNIYKAL